MVLRTVKSLPDQPWHDIACAQTAVGLWLRWTYQPIQARGWRIDERWKEQAHTINNA